MGQICCEIDICFCQFVKYLYELLYQLHLYFSHALYKRGRLSCTCCKTKKYHEKINNFLFGVCGDWHSSLCRVIHVFFGIWDCSSTMRCSLRTWGWGNRRSGTWCGYQNVLLRTRSPGFTTVLFSSSRFFAFTTKLYSSATTLLCIVLVFFCKSRSPSNFYFLIIHH